MSQPCFAVKQRPHLKFLMGLLLIFLLPIAVLAQTKTVTGTVTDETGSPVEGASVMVKNTKTGTTTDAAGKFTISVQPTAELEISSINYELITILVGTQNAFNISLKPKAGSINDVVVVGYATQKKVNLTGAVSSISSKDLATRPVTNVSSALSGLAAGVFVRQGSGKPGSDGATIRIRGLGTLNNSDPLILVDGIIGSMDAVNPDDVQSISILKDAASASIYGTLGANGVVLITTKKGNKGKTSVTYTGYGSITQPMNKIQFVTNYARHMGLINESLTNLGQASLFPQARIDEWNAATANPNGTNANGVPNWLAYPNTDWYDAIVESKVSQNHNVSVSGGSEKMTYLLSLNYLNNPGLMANTGTERYLLRANIESKINKVITIGTQTFASLQSYGMANTDNAFNFLSQTSPGVYPMYQGKFGYPSAQEESANANNITSYLYGTGGKNNETRINTSLYANFNIFKGLVFESKVNYQTRFNERNSYAKPTDRWDFATNILRFASATPDLLTTSYSFNKDYRVTIDDVLRYNTSIGDHDIGALVGYNEFYFNYYDFNASKLGLIDNTITTLGSAGNTANNAGGQEYDRAIRSVFGRVNYAYKNKYLVEGNLRYDGTSRFPTNNRWGYYPGVSVGWKLSEEKFFSGLKGTVSNLKLRASWGKLGNFGATNDGSASDYAYMGVYSPVNYSFNGIAAPGLWANTIANPLLTWEKTTQTNIGFEATLFKSLNIDVEYYNRQTDGILTRPGIPGVLGTATPPLQNTAAVVNKGIEVSLNYSKKLGALELYVGGNIAYNKNEVTKYKGKLQEGFQDVNGVKTFVSNIGAVSDNGANSLIVEDHMMYDFYMQTTYRGNGAYTNSDGSVNVNGGPKDGMIRTPDDMTWVKSMIAAGYSFAPVAGTSTATNKALLNYGDLLYNDNNGDGIYGNTFDRKFTGTSTTPKYNFGVNLGASWKGIDISMLWAGSTGMQYYWNDGFNTTTTRNGFHVTETIANDHYYFNEANPADPNNNINGKFPRLKYNTDPQNTVFSDFWLYNASYVKLKNLQIGYTIPARIASKALISRARVYLSGENLLLITNYPGLDPEIGASFGYPTMRQFSGGITVTF